MSRRVYLYFALVVLLGAALGGAGVYYYLWFTGRVWHHGRFNREHAVAHMKRELNLSDSQVEQIKRIFDETTQKLRNLQQQIDPQFRALRDETRARIRQVLNPEQARKFDEFVREIDARHRRRGPFPPPPPPPPPPPSSP